MYLHVTIQILAKDWGKRNNSNTGEELGNRTIQILVKDWGKRNNSNTGEGLGNRTIQILVKDWGKRRKPVQGFQESARSIYCSTTEPKAKVDYPSMQRKQELCSFLNKAS